jgi:hypothetical protein
MNRQEFVEANGVRRNERGGFYMKGKSFTEAQWVVIVEAYANELDSKGKCTVRRLADLCKISHASAKKAIDFYDEGAIRLAPRGHGRRGIGTLKELTA